MGNREALLKAARESVVEVGLAGSSARVVASRAGVSTAAIGYHFGTTQRLVTLAVLDGMRAWAEHMTRLVDTAARSGSRAAVWDALIESFAGHEGALAASYELLSPAAQPEVRKELAAQVDAAGQFLARALGAEDAAARSAYALLNGLITLWLIDPSLVPRGSALVASLPALA